jgi:hypothetical protein
MEAGTAPHVAPEFLATGYTCPFCDVWAQMEWLNPSFGPGIRSMALSYNAQIWQAVCLYCGGRQVWVQEQSGGSVVMVYPLAAVGPHPHIDMPDDVKADYEEARHIVQVSPRGACALLRLAAQRLVNDHLQRTGGDLNDRIGKLVNAGLPSMIQQALDTLRVIGGEAVHPGELDLRDDSETAAGLFRCLNVIVENQIAGPAHVEQMFGKLPESKVAAIEKRDSPPGGPERGAVDPGNPNAVAPRRR